ncbi:MAG: hypothetical protein AABX48_02605 [Nanoarchaeota archaeon]
MPRDKSHMEQVERWAGFTKKNPAIARKEVNKLVDAQIMKSKEFYERLEKVKGKEFVKKLRLKS